MIIQDKWSVFIMTKIIFLYSCGAVNICFSIPVFIWDIWDLFDEIINMEKCQGKYVEVELEI